jgi:hypothetical protein
VTHLCPPTHQLQYLQSFMRYRFKRQHFHNYMYWVTSVK